MLTQTHRDELETRGITCLRGFLAPDDAAAMQERVWAFLAARGIDRADRATWPAGGVSKLQGLRHGDVFAPFTNAALHGIVDELLGGGTWDSPSGTGQALLSFPQPGPWAIPHTIWHFDLPAKGTIDRLDAVRLLGIVDHVETRGGGTLVVEGSHELVRRLVAASPEADAGRSADVRKRLVRERAWFRALVESGPVDERIERLMVDGDEIDGVRVRVSETTGEPGDLYVMHPWMLHNIAMNCAERPRMMMTHTVYRRDATFYGG